MKIAIGSDHAGWAIKQKIIAYLHAQTISVTDFGTFGVDSVDYPDYARPVAQAVAKGSCDYGILVCYTGIGMSISANKVPGIRAALANTRENVKLTREHNDANILCLGAKDVDVEQLNDIIHLFLTTSFAHGRHERRIEKVMELEAVNEKR